MLSLSLLTLLAAASPEAKPVRAFVPGNAVRVSAQATVRLLNARTVPMSAESAIDAPQRRTTVRLADGDHDALIVEFE